MKTEQSLYEALANTYDHWLSTAVKSMENADSNLQWTDQPEAFQKLAEALRETENIPSFEQVLSEIIRGVLHSTLVTLDGGTTLAEKTNLTITDDNGYELHKYLHEEFVSFLLETGRLK